MNNLFDVINPQMFSVFVYGDKRTNYELLSFIYDVFMSKRNVQIIAREDLVDDLKAYIDTHIFEDFDEEEGFDKQNQDHRYMASTKIARFKKTGWLEEDTTEGFVTTLSLTNDAIMIMEAFQNLVEREEKPVEFTGYFYLIAKALDNFDFHQAKGLLEQIYEETLSLFHGLQGLLPKIRRFTERMINDEKLSPKEVLDLLVDKYRNQVLLKVFYNLKTRDNPSKYTSHILAVLNDLRYNHMDEIVQNVLETDWIVSPSEELKKEIYDRYADRLEECIRRFESVDNLVSLIDEKNTKFHTSAQAKFEFLLNNKKDVSGLLQEALKCVKESKPGDDFGSIIPLQYAAQVDENSLYNRAKAKEKPEVYYQETPLVSKEDLDLAMARLFMEDIYSRDRVNDFVHEELGDKKEKNSKDIHVNSWNRLIMLMMIEAYSSYSEMDYEVHFHDDYYETFGYKTKSFDIVLKEKTA